ncbi:hypothetical protein MRX96_020436 [Rhipicephalus microplus]
MTVASALNRRKAGVEPQQEGDEDARNDDVSQAEHGKVLARKAALKEILGENQFDGCFERLGDDEHDVCAKDPKDVVDKEATEEDATRCHGVYVQQLDAINSKGKPKQVVGHPVLFSKIPDSDETAEDPAGYVIIAEAVIEVLSALIGLRGRPSLEGDPILPPIKVAGQQFSQDTAERGAQYVSHG